MTFIYNTQPGSSEQTTSSEWNTIMPPIDCYKTVQLSTDCVISDQYPNSVGIYNVMTYDASVWAVYKNIPLLRVYLA